MTLKVILDRNLTISGTMTLIALLCSVAMWQTAVLLLLCIPILLFLSAKNRLAASGESPLPLLDMNHNEISPNELIRLHWHAHLSVSSNRCATPNRCLISCGSVCNYWPLCVCVCVCERDCDFSFNLSEIKKKKQ